MIEQLKRNYSFI